MGVSNDRVLSLTSIPEEFLVELQDMYQQGQLPISAEFQAFLTQTAAQKTMLAAARQRSVSDPYWQTLRPSMIRTVAQGASCWTSVDLIECDMPGVAIRSALENFGIKVNYFPVGRAQHVVNVLSGEASTAPYVILAMHGGDNALLLPPLYEKIAATERFNERLTPTDLDTFVHLPGRVVISLGCDTGTPDLAEVFLRHGCVAYIGPQGAPFGYASVFVPIFLFYELTEMRTLEHAMERLRQHDHELAMWRFYTSEDG